MRVGVLKVEGGRKPTRERPPRSPVQPVLWLPTCFGSRVEAGGAGHMSDEAQSSEPSSRKPHKKGPVFRRSFLTLLHSTQPNPSSIPIQSQPITSAMKLLALAIAPVALLASLGAADPQFQLTQIPRFPLWQVQSILVHSRLLITRRSVAEKIQPFVDRTGCNGSTLPLPPHSAQSPSRGTAVPLVTRGDADR